MSVRPGRSGLTRDGRFLATQDGVMMCEDRGLYKVSVAVMGVGPIDNWPYNATSLMRGLADRVSAGSYDWLNCVRSTFPPIGPGPTVSVSCIWPCGHSIAAVFDLDDPDAPKVARLMVTRHSAEGSPTPADSGEYSVSVAVTSHVEIDYHHDDVISALADIAPSAAWRIADKCTLFVAHYPDPQPIRYKAPRPESPVPASEQNGGNSDPL